MYSKEKLKRDIDTMWESIRNDRYDLATKDLTPEERARRLNYIDWCTNEIKDLNQKLDQAT